MPWSSPPKRSVPLSWSSLPPSWSFIAGASFLGLVVLIVAVHVLARST